MLTENRSFTAEDTEDTEEAKSKPQFKIATLPHKPRQGWGTQDFFFLEICLEQGRRAALPGLAFFFGNVFHVSDVGSSLG